MLMAYGFSMLTNTLLASLFPVFNETNRTLCVLLVILGYYLIGKQSERVIISVAIPSGISVVVVPAACLLFRSLSFGSLLPWSVAILMGFLSRTIRKNNAYTRLFGAFRTTVDMVGADGIKLSKSID